MENVTHDHLGERKIDQFQFCGAFHDSALMIGATLCMTLAYGLPRARVRIMSGEATRLQCCKEPVLLLSLSRQANEGMGWHGSFPSTPLIPSHLDRVSCTAETKTRAR